MNSLELLIELAEKIAQKKSDGHLTMLKFTTGWKVFLGTPNLDTGVERDNVAEVDSFPTLEKALHDFIVTQTSIAK